MYTQEQLNEAKHLGMRVLETILNRFRIMGGNHGPTKPEDRLLMINRMADATHNIPQAIEIIESRNNGEEGHVLEWAVEEVGRAATLWQELCQKFYDMEVRIYEEMKAIG